MNLHFLSTCKSLIMALMSFYVIACAGTSTTPDGEAEPIEQEPVDDPLRISWRLPTEREDGQPLDMFDLAFVEVYYRFCHENHGAREILWVDPIFSHVDVEGLPPACYKFFISVQDTLGAWSKTLHLGEITIEDQLIQ